MLRCYDISQVLQHQSGVATSVKYGDIKGSKPSAFKAMSGHLAARLVSEVKKRWKKSAAYSRGGPPLLDIISISISITTSIRKLWNIRSMICLKSGLMQAVEEECGLLKREPSLVRLHQHQQHHQGDTRVRLAAYSRWGGPLPCWTSASSASAASALVSK